MKCLFCVKYLGDERHQANINLGHHTYQVDLQHTHEDLFLKSPLCNSGNTLSWNSIAKLKLIKNLPVTQLTSELKMMLPFQKTATEQVTSN